MMISMRSSGPGALLLAACLATESQAQGRIDIGTEPAAETALADLGDSAFWYTQTFVAQGPYLRSLSIWYYGGTRRSAADEDHFTNLFVTQGYLEDDANGFSHAVSLDPAHQGRYDIFFDDVAMTPGSTYAFHVFLNNASCGSGSGIGESDCGFTPVTGELNPFFIEVTKTDAYAGGFLRVRNDYDEPNQDIRFVATFVGVPEPGVMILLLTGLVGIAGVAARRRRASP